MLKTLGLVAALSLAGLPACASDLPDYPFIHASGAAAQHVAPDRGAIDFEISAYDPNPERARALVEERIAQVRAVIDAQGEGAAEFESRDVRKEYHKGEAVHEGVNVDVKCTVHINVRDLTKWRAIVQPLLDMPNVDGMSTEFDIGERDKVEIELSANAIRDATRKAQALAAGFGKKLGPVTAVTAGQLKNVSRAMGLVASDYSYSKGGKRSAETRDFLMIESIKMAQSVDVIFRIK